jgi:hypothetical protein
MCRRDAVRVLIATAFVALCVGNARAQNVIIQDERVHTARRLAGVIHGGESDLPGRILPGATVELCAAHWKHCSVKVVADSNGSFALAPKQHHNVYYLRISQENFSPLLLKVHLDSHARNNLAVSLSAAT